MIAEVKFRPTKPQRAFINSPTRNTAFIGGIGSGKTRASVVKALGMPANTIGMLVAPTFPMLRDTIVRTFSDIISKAPGALHSFNQSELRAKLFDGKEILFRSSDNPERLRGPNLAWAGLDEAALMKRETLDIMLGRLRLEPGTMWFTTTPKGKAHWLAEYIDTGNVEVHRSRTMDNPHLPQAYLDSLKSQYSSVFYQQEVLGEFVDMGGTRVKREWLRVGEPPDVFERVTMGVDLAISTKSDADYTAAVILGTLNGRTWILHAEHTRTGFHGVLAFIQSLADRYKPAIIAIESVQYQAAVVEELLRSTNLPIQAVRPDKDKLTRFLPLEARYEQGLVYHAPNLMAYTDELLSFPHGAHDDLVDAAAYAYNALTGTIARVRSL
jgi:predicted phage terminase large subunit-like protein